MHFSIIKSRPPSNSLASFWYNNASTVNLFTIVLQNSDIIDIDVQYVNANSSDGASSTETGTAMTAGLYYFNFLDGFSSKKLSPVSNPAIA